MTDSLFNDVAAAASLNRPQLRPSPEEKPMRIGASLFLIAVGAILRFAIDTNHQNTHGFNVGTAGVILMIVGAIGLIVSAIWMSTRRRTDVITQGPAGTRGTTYVEPANPINGPY